MNDDSNFITATEAAKKRGFSIALCQFIATLEQFFPDCRYDVSWCEVTNAIENDFSTSDIIKLTLTAPHCAGEFEPTYNPPPSIEELIANGEELYARHCNADGSFRFEDFDTPEKLEAFKREREQLEAAKHADNDDADDADEETH